MGLTIYKFLAFILALIGLMSLVSAANVYSDVNHNNHRLYNISNISADLFIGNGSLLSGIVQDNSSWNQSYANTIYAPINYGDDWNKTYADLLYYSISNPFNFYNITTLPNLNSSGLIINWNSSGFITNQTQDLSPYYLNTNPANYWNSTYSPFNKTYTDTLYAPISLQGDNSSWNESYARTIFYNTELELTTLLDNNYAPINYGDDWNKTYADTLYRLDNWNNFTGIPTATPSISDTTHLSTAAQIYSWVTSLTYTTKTYVDTLVGSVGNWSSDKADYWKNDGSSTATEDWDLDGNSITADGVTIGNNQVMVEEETNLTIGANNLTAATITTGQDVFFEGDLYIKTDAKIYLGNSADAYISYNGTKLIIAG
jgi:hypothetical protein